MRLVAVDRKQRRRDVYAHMHAPSAHPPQG
jgi:hypothetical protein